MEQDGQVDAIALASELTIAWLGNPNTRAGSEDVPNFLQSMYDAVLALAVSPTGEDAAELPAAFPPAVSVRKSLASPERIISMIDGKPYSTLKRHLSSNGLTPDEYRTRYNLRSDYPMVAPAYSEARRETAKKLGLGRKPAAAAPAPAPEPAAEAATPAKKPRRGKRAAATAEPA